jgi:quercetin dioxygenase-like cupin family protein
VRIRNLYEDENGESHWREIEIEWSDLTPVTSATSRMPATSILFREYAETFDIGWHPAPCRQYVIVLDGDAEVTTSDEEARIIKAGEVFLIEDVKGKGHRARNLAGRPLHTVFVAIE